MFFKEQLLSSSQYNIEKLSNKLFVWGLNTSGQVGPVLYLFSLAQISAGASHIVALTSDNRLLTWGLNSSGQLGTGDTINRSFPTQIAASGWRRVRAGQSHTVAIRGDGELFVWGNNAGGQLGNSSTINRSSPTQIGLGNLLDASAGASFTIVLSGTGSLYAWGVNTQGQIGDSTTITKSSPVQITNTSWLSIASGIDHTLALSSNLTLFGWGLNNQGQLGSPQYSWASITSGKGSHSAAIRSDGLLFTWGLNNAGQLGDNTTITKSAIVQIGTSSWISVTVGNSFTVATLAGGSLFAWGLNSSGQLGDNSVVNKSSPVLISIASWISITAGIAHTIALTNSSGLMFGWGLNTSGQLGNNTTLNRSNPTLIGGPSISDISTNGLTLTLTQQALLDPSIVPFSNVPATIANNSVSYSMNLNKLGAQNGTTDGITTPSISGFAIGGYTNYTIELWFYITAWNNSLPRTNQLYSLGAGFGALWHAMGVNSTGYIWWGYGSGAWAFTGTFQSNPGLITPGIWYHAALVKQDTTYTIYLNGVNVASTTFTVPNGQSGTLFIGSYFNDANSDFSYHKGYISNFRMVADTAVYTANFTPPTSPLTAITGTQLLTSYAGTVTAFTQLSAGGDQSFGLSNGLLYAWGLNSSGQLGDNGTINKSIPAQIGSSSWTAVSSGTSHAIALNSDSLLFAWGGNGDYNLGDGTLIDKSSPVQVGSTSYSLISAGSNHSFAIDTTNALYGWGTNELGQLGINQVPDGQYLQITTTIAGGNRGAFIKNDNTLWIWGLNSQGQIGDGTTLFRSSPVQVAGSWSQISLGAAITGAITTNGVLFMWGRGLDGAMGDGTTISKSSPVQVTGISSGSWRQITCGGSGNGTAMGIFKADAIANAFIYGWGTNGSDVFGNGNTTPRSQPSLARAASTSTTGWSWVHIGQNQNASYALRGDYTMVNSGVNNEGQLGNNTTVNSVAAGPTGSWLQVTGNGATTYAIRSDGLLFAWGSNTQGQLGINNIISRSSPVQVGTGFSWSRISSGEGTLGIAVRADNTLWAWGFATVGDGTTLNRSSPVQIGSNLTWNSSSTGKLFGGRNVIDSNGYIWLWSGAPGTFLTPNVSVVRSNPTLVAFNASTPQQIGTSSWSQINAATNFSLARTSDGLIRSWGLDENGQLGDNQTLARSSPVQVFSSTIVSPTLVFSGSWGAVAAGKDYSLGINSVNELYGWGLNSSGQLGINNTISRSSPVQILAGTSFTRVSAGFNHAGAIASDSLLYMWGNNASFQLGDQTTISKSSPVLTTTGSWALISLGNGITIATNNTKLLYTWGSGTLGISADGTTLTRSSPTLVSFTQTISQSSPIQIGAESWTSISSGNNYFVALRSDNLLYSWGNNANGQLGINDTINRSSPVLIGTSSWIAVSAAGGSAGINQVIAIRSDRRLFGWGVNANGMLPTGLQGNSWETIATNGSHTVAIRSDSTLWAWGLNNAGQLGLGNTINRSSPVQIGGAAAWSNVAIGLSHSLAFIGFDLYAWGLNNAGQLGLGNTINRSSPVIVSGQYAAVTAGASFTAATEFFGTLRTWGLNSSGQLGDNTTINKSTPTQLASPFDTLTWTVISAGAAYMGAIEPNSTNVYMWGLGSSGQLGTGTTLARSNPTILGGAPLTVLDVSSFATTVVKQGTNFITNNVPIIGAVAGTFGGTSADYLQLNSATQFNVGDTNFTVEAWFYSIGNGVIIQYGLPTGQVSFWIRVIGTTTASVQFEQFNVGSTSPLFNFASANILRNTWYHAAWVVNSLGVYTGYLDGVNINNGGGYNNNHIYNPTRIRIGGPTNAAYGTFFNGYVSNVRIVKGVAVYTGNFLKPTSIFATTQSAGTNISAITGTQTSLLIYTTQAASITGGIQIYGSQLSAGATQAFLIDPVNNLYAWGLGTFGALGVGDVISRSAPIQIGLSSWTLVAAERVTGNGALAVDAEGRLFAWGGLTAQNLIGNSSTITRSSPVQVTAWTANRLLSMSVGGTNIAIVRDDRLLYNWGPNLTGQVGDGTTIYKSTPTQIGPTIASTSSPVQIGTFSNWDKVSLGFSTAAVINTSGRLYLWGSDNQFGTLGSNSTIRRLVPTEPIDSSSWTQVSSGNYHVLALTSDNRMFAWGLNNVFKVGDSTSVNKSSPVQIGTGSSWTRVAAGNNHSLAIRSDGQLYAWGQNDAGQLGIITEPKLWTQLSTGQSSAFAIRSDGLLYAWGLNSSGELGLTDVLTRSSPTQIGASSWTQISNNFSNTVAIRSDGKLFTWGAGNALLGDGTIVAKSSPVQIGNSSWSQVSVGFSHVLAIDATGILYGWGVATALNASTVAYSWSLVSENNAHVAAIRSDGLLFVWGLNSSGQLGNNTIISQSSPIQIGTSSWISVSAGFDHTIAITSNNRLFAWGNNIRYQIGDNTSINKSSPVQVGLGISWSQVSAGLSYSMAITTNDELYGWGIGTGGQLGALTEIRSWTNIDAGFSTSAAIRSDNTLFVWGLNSSGQIGDATTINKSSPVQVPAVPNTPASWNLVSTGLDHTLAVTSAGQLYGWGNAVSGATGNYGEVYSWSMVAGSGDNWYGIRSDGSLWATGSNTRGALGLNDTVARSSPTQVGSSSYIFVNAGSSTNFGTAMAITTDNRLFGWGYNELGQLGLNDTINRSSPTQIDAGNLYSYAAIFTHSLLIRTNGTMWATGFNSTEGRLGLNDLISRSNPTQIGTSTWTVAFATDSHSLAIRSDNTLWTWGRGTENQLGNGTSINRSSPVQVTSPGTSPWIGIAGGFAYSVGITGLGLGTPYSVYVWGGNNNGATGLNTTVGNNATPVVMKAGSAGNSFVQVATNPSAGASTPNTFILSSNGQMWSMGHFSLLGDNVTNISRSSPVLVFGSTSWSQLPKMAGDVTMGVLATNSTLWTWGNINNYTTYGPGILQSSPVQVGGNIRWGSYNFPLYTINSEPGQGSWTAVEAGQSFSLGIKNNLAYGWGQNSSGQTGTNQSRNPILSPIQIGTNSWNLVRASIGGNFAGGIDSNNMLFMWGSGIAQLALTSSNVAPKWNQLSIGLSHGIGLKSDGTLWVWGGNAAGQLGDGTTISQSSPVQIGTSSWIQVTTGANFSLAMRTDGTIWSWGENFNGVLGISPLTGNRSSPVQIGTSSWSLVASGYYSAYGILPNGQLFSWGDNAQGQLALNDIVNRSSPTLVFGGGTYRYVHSSGRLTAAIRTDNTLWTFGYGASGGIGNGGLAAQASPIQVTTGSSTWSKVVVFGTIGANENLITGMAGITTAGVLYTWGAFANGAGARIPAAQVTIPTLTVVATSLSFTNITSGIAGCLFATDINNNLYAWGDNSFGQLGLSNTINRSSPTLLTSAIGTSWELLNNMANGYNGSLVNSNLDSYIWGNNSSGQLGLGDTINRSSPVQLAGSWVQLSNIYNYSFLSPILSVLASSPVQIGNSSWTQLSVGGSHSLAISSDGLLFTWGVNNSNSQLGFNDTINRSSPTQLGTSSWSQVAAGLDHSIAIRIDGTLWGWGNNTQGQVGLITTPYSWTEFSTSDTHRLAIRNDGLLFAWGTNAAGQLGQNNTITYSSPVQIGTSSWTKVGAGSSFSVAIDTLGRLYVWGLNNSNQLGNNLTTPRSSPIQIANTVSFNQISAGFDHSAAIDITNKLYVWGNRQATSLNPLIYSWSQVTNNMAGSFTVAIRSDGLLYSWGLNNVGQLGDLSVISKSSPVLLGAESWTTVCTGISHTVAQRFDNTWWSWGGNSSGQLGDNSTINKSSPVQIAGSYNQMSAGSNHSLARNNNNLLFAWGSNTAGQLGDGTTINKSSPTSVGSSSFTFVSAGGDTTNGFSLAIRNDDTLWGWGINSLNQLGVGFIFNQSSPVQVGSNTWRSVSAGFRHSLGIDINYLLYVWGESASVLLQTGMGPITNSWTQLTQYKFYNDASVGGGGLRIDNMIYSWGQNPFGQLGLGDTIARSSPVIVGQSSWVQIAGSGYHTLAIRSDGTLWAWGRNNSGQLGISDTINRSSPIQISSSSWSKVAAGPFHSLALNNNGEIYAWGQNNVGQLGNSSTINRSSPILVSSSSFSLIAAGGVVGNSLAIRVDGTLWSWGSGTNFYLGDGTTISKSSPIQIGTSSWIQVDVGYGMGLGITTAYRLFTWGEPTAGQLGNNSTINFHSVPVQVAAAVATSFIHVAAGAYNTFAVASNNLAYGVGSNINRAVRPDSVSSQFTDWQGIGSSIAKQYDGYYIATNSLLYTVFNIDLSNTIKTAYTLAGPVVTGSNGTEIPYRVRTNIASYTQVNAGNSVSMVIDSLGKLYAWGFGTNGQVGIGSSIAYSSPIQISSGNSFIFVNSQTGPGFAITTSNLLFTWGLNTAGQVGDFTVANKVTPSSLSPPANTLLDTAIPILVNTSSWTLVTAGRSFTGATNTTYKLFTWGLNSSGQLGSNSTINRSSPAQVTSFDLSSTQISAGGSHLMLLTDGGALYGTGNNANGQLGDNTTINRQLLTLINQPADLNVWNKIEAGTNHTLALRQNLLFAWGLNSSGQIGDNTTISKSSPVQIGSATYIDVNAGETVSGAIANNSALFTWGATNIGDGFAVSRSNPLQIGNNADINTLSPVQISTSSWTAISAGAQYTFARDVNNNIYAWGQDNFGQLGL